MLLHFADGSQSNETRFANWGDLADMILYLQDRLYYEVDRILLRYEGGEIDLGVPPYYLHETIPEELLEGDYQVEIPERARDAEGRVIDSEFVHRFSQWMIMMEDQVRLHTPVLPQVQFVEPGQALMAQLLAGFLGIPAPSEERLLANALRDLLAGSGIPRLGEDVKIVATPEEIAEFPRKTFAELQERLLENCPICLEAYQDADELLCLTTCPHYFHTACIIDWLTKSSNKCPLCRVPTGQGRPSE